MESLTATVVPGPAQVFLSSHKSTEVTMFSNPLQEGVAESLQNVITTFFNWLPASASCYKRSLQFLQLTFVVRPPVAKHSNRQVDVITEMTRPRHLGQLMP